MTRFHPFRTTVALAVLALAPALAACGGATPPHTTAAATPVAVRYLAAGELERDLANAFHAGLYRLAVMSQPADDAADLGQDLPTGTLTNVRCAAAGARPADTAPWRWRCTVRWRTVGGLDRATRYEVRSLPSGCFAAGATPRLPDHRDTTIASYSEHPLNALVSVRTGC